MPFVFVVPGPLRQFSGGRADVRVDGSAASVREALHLLWRECPGARDRVLTELGDVRPHVNVFVDGENVRSAGGLDTTIRDGAEIIIVPAVSGGATVEPEPCPMRLGPHGAQHPVSRPRVGRAGPRRHRVLRVHHARGGTGGSELGNDPQEAGRLSRGVRRLRSREGRALHAGSRRAAAAERRHRPQPAEGREHRPQRESLPRRPEGVRFLRRLCLAIRRTAHRW